MYRSVQADKVLLQWLSRLESADPSATAAAGYSIAIDSPCTPGQPRLAMQLASFLNEFDPDLDDAGWLPINPHRLEQFEANVLLREMLIGSGAFAPADLIAYFSSQRRVILELPDCHRNSMRSPHVFEVSLGGLEPPARQSHLWLNSMRIPEKSLVHIIASAFLDWTANGGDLAGPNPFPA